jgi:hypothetical protein
MTNVSKQRKGKSLIYLQQSGVRTISILVLGVAARRIRGRIGTGRMGPSWRTSPGCSQLVYLPFTCVEAGDKARWQAQAQARGTKTKRWGSIHTSIHPSLAHKGRSELDRTRPSQAKATDWTARLLFRRRPWSHRLRPHATHGRERGGKRKRGSRQPVCSGLVWSGLVKGCLCAAAARYRLEVADVELPRLPPFREEESPRRCVYARAWPADRVICKNRFLLLPPLLLLLLLAGGPVLARPRTWRGWGRLARVRMRRTLLLALFSIAVLVV